MGADYNQSKRVKGGLELLNSCVFLPVIISGLMRSPRSSTAQPDRVRVRPGERERREWIGRGCFFNWQILPGHEVAFLRAHPEAKAGRETLPFLGNPRSKPTRELGYLTFNFVCLKNLHMHRRPSGTFDSHDIGECLKIASLQSTQVKIRIFRPVASMK